MIVVKVELHSVVTHKITELARIHIANDETGTFNSRNYKAISFRGRDKNTLDKGTVQKSTELKNWKSNQFHIWNLVRAILTNLGYTQGQNG